MNDGGGRKDTIQTYDLFGYNADQLEIVERQALDMYRLDALTHLMQCSGLSVTSCLKWMCDLAERFPNSQLALSVRETGFRGLT